MPRLGLKTYYQHKLEELDVILRQKEQNVRRLEAQRNDWNEKGAWHALLPYRMPRRAVER